MIPPSEKGISDMDSICIKLRAVHNRLAAVERWPGTSGQVESYYVSFDLATPDWDGLTVTAVFTDGTISKDVLDIKDGAPVPVPHECMATVGRAVSVALYGTDGKSVVLTTTYARLFRTDKGADPADDTSTAPALPVWAQIQADMGDLSDLDTEDKSTLVAAINEAAQSGGGGGGAGTAVLYTPQTLTEEQQTQARENIAAVAGGEVLPLRVTLTAPSVPDGSYTADKTFAEITAAYNAGRAVELYDGENVLSMTYLASDEAAFGVTFPPSPDGTTYLDVLISSQDEISISNSPIVDWGSIYEDMQGALPLGMTGAKAGQIAQVADVDSDGKPTEWTPVDMPGAASDIKASTWADFRSGGLRPGSPWKAVIITDVITGSDGVISSNAPYYAQLITAPDTSSWTYRITDSKGSTYLYTVAVFPNSWAITSETYTQESEVSCVPVSELPDAYTTPMVRYNMGFYLWRDSGPV